MDTDPPTDSRDVDPSKLDSQQLGDVLEGYRAQLRRMVDIRLDPRVRGRVDASDVIQETFIEVTRRVGKNREFPDGPFFLWVRGVAGHMLMQFHRRHLATQKRDAGREVRIEYGGVPQATSVLLASAIAASGMLSPSKQAVQGEQVEALQDALEQLKPGDREILVLRHFEQVTNGEAAQILGLTDAGASLRYLRAAQKLHGILKTFRSSTDRSGG